MIAYGLEVYKHLLLQSEFLFSPFAEGVGFELQEAGCRLPVAVLSPDGFFIARLFEITETDVQVQTVGRDANSSRSTPPRKGHCLTLSDSCPQPHNIVL